MGKRGPQPGAGGRPRKALADKILDGNSKKLQIVPLPDGDSESGSEMPKPADWLSATQKNGHPLIANEIYTDTWGWLGKHKCSHLVPKQQIEQYAMSAARWIQCEQAISEYGLLAKHPTTGAPIASPYVSMAQSFSKQTYSLWAQIFAIVRENSLTDCSNFTPQDDLMERLLTARKGK